MDGSACQDGNRQDIISLNMSLGSSSTSMLARSLLPRYKEVSYAIMSLSTHYLASSAADIVLA